MSGLVEIIVEALREFLLLLFSPIRALIETYASDLVRTVVSTPHPNAVFSRPTNGAWPGIYDYYWETVIPLALMLWGLSVGLVIFFQSTNHLFSSYHRAKLTRRALAGLLGLLAWWWVAAVSLRFIDALTGFIVPDLSDVSLFQTLSFSAIGVLGVVLTLAVDLALFGLIALIYLARQVVLYLFVLLMPLLIVFWIPGVGPFTLVAGFMRRLAGFYVPFLFMTVPVALLFRLAGLLGEGTDLSMGGFGAWLAALLIPLVALAAPLVLVWQAGALFFVADRVSRRVSTRQARTRAAGLATAGGTVVQEGEGFLRGVRGQPAVRSDGQYLLDSNSRGHQVGTRLNTAGGRLRETFRAGRDSGVTRNDPMDGSRSDGASDSESVVQLVGPDTPLDGTVPAENGPSSATGPSAGRGQPRASDSAPDSAEAFPNLQDRTRPSTTPTSVRREREHPAERDRPNGDTTDAASSGDSADSVDSADVSSDDSNDD